MRIAGLGFAVAAAGWMGLIFYFSSLSGTPSVDESFQPLESAAVYWQGGLSSYAGHALLYGVLAALILAARWAWTLGLGLQRVIIAALLSSLFGLSDEYHQSFVFGREATAADFLVDSVAATASSALIWTLTAGRNRMAF